MNHYRLEDDEMNEESEMSEQEIHLADEFIELARAGNNPGVEEFLSRHPQYEENLRPVVEGAALFSAEVRRFKRQYPGLKLAQLLGVPMNPRP